jgi:hypothetical protein
MPLLTAKGFLLDVIHFSQAGFGVYAGDYLWGFARGLIPA